MLRNSKFENESLEVKEKEEVETLENELDPSEITLLKNVIERYGKSVQHGLQKYSGGGYIA
jgi:hypothetical protein